MKKKKGPRKPPNTSGLRPWPKGVSGNPAGRPKSMTLSEAYRHRLEELVPNDPEGRNWGELIADRIIARALKGQVAAASEIADRTEGKPAQFMELKNASPILGSGPIFNVNFISPKKGQDPALPQSHSDSDDHSANSASMEEV